MGSFGKVRDGKLCGHAAQERHAPDVPPSRRQLAGPVTVNVIGFTNVAWSPKGAVVAVGTRTGAVQLFDPTALHAIGDPIIAAPGGDEDEITGLAQDSSGTKLAVDDFTGRVWSFESWTDRQRAPT